jgi:hypothetical protein
LAVVVEEQLKARWRDQISMKEDMEIGDGRCYATHNHNMMERLHTVDMAKRKWCQSSVSKKKSVYLPQDYYYHVLDVEGTVEFHCWMQNSTKEPTKTRMTNQLMNLIHYAAYRKANVTKNHLRMNPHLHFQQTMAVFRSCMAVVRVRANKDVMMEAVGRKKNGLIVFGEGDDGDVAVGTWKAEMMVCEAFPSRVVMKVECEDWALKLTMGIACPWVHSKDVDYDGGGCGVNDEDEDGEVVAAMKMMVVVAVASKGDYLSTKKSEVHPRCFASEVA